MTRRTRARSVTLAALLVSAVALAACSSSPSSSSTTTTGAAASSTGVETPSSASLSETGSTLLYPLWNIWVPAYHQKYSQVTMTTAGTGSGTGITDASNGTVDIGSSDAYLSSSQLQAHPTLLNIPLAISVQVVGYNVPGVTAHLKLSGMVLSEIYQGKITTWNDPAITSLNPGVTLPSTPIVTLHRSDGSGDTFLFSQYLSKADPSGWGTKVSYGTTVPWPAAPGALGEKGNGGMVSGCKETVGCIAYVGISYLAQLLGNGQTYAAIGNGKGQYVLPTAANVAAEASYFAPKTPATGTISMIYGPVSNGYPIINYEYAIVDSHQSSSSTAKAVRSVLQWAISPADGNSSQYLSQVNFQPLPSKVVSQSSTQIAKIQ